MPPATNKTAFAGTTEDVATVWGSFASSRVVLTAHFLDDSAAVLHQILWKGMHSQGVGDEGGRGASLKVEERKEIIRLKREWKMDQNWTKSRATPTHTEKPLA